MGLAFIRSTARSHTKSWNAEYLKAGSDLFASVSAPIERTLLSTVIPGAGAIRDQECVHVRLLEERVFVYRELTLLGEIEKPSLDIVEGLRSCYGVVDAYVEEVNEIAGVI